MPTRLDRLREENALGVGDRRARDIAALIAVVDAVRTPRCICRDGVAPWHSAECSQATREALDNALAALEEEA